MEGVVEPPVGTSDPRGGFHHFLFFLVITSTAVSRFILCTVFDFVAFCSEHRYLIEAAVFQYFERPARFKHSTTPRSRLADHK
jgi:hypothetical protein